jgi:hypothetical protein
MRCRSRRPDDAPLRAQLRELAIQRRRFGYRRLHILMIWEGLHMNHKKLRRLYREEGLQVRRRIGRKRALGSRTPMAIPTTEIGGCKALRACVLRAPRPALLLHQATNVQINPGLSSSLDESWGSAHL